MCDTPECNEILMNITNNIIPNILKSSEGYVVKGGKASDYYIKKQSGEVLNEFTDWDIACKTKEIQEAIYKQIKDTITKNYSSYKIIEENVRTKDEKKGIQIGINCNGKDCFFVDLIIYSASDKIYQNNETNNGIIYISKSYLLDDLKQTYEDRINDLTVFLQNWDVNLIPDPSKLDDGYKDYLRLIRILFDKKLKTEHKQNINSIDNESSQEIDEEERNEIIQEYNDRYIKGIEELENIIIPDIESRIKKLIRTKSRYEQLIQKKGGKKMRKLKSRNKSRNKLKSRNKSRNKSHKKSRNKSRNKSRKNK
jgi:hypothetical protein